MSKREKSFKRLNKIMATAFFLAAVGLTAAQGGEALNNQIENVDVQSWKSVLSWAHGTENLILSKGSPLSSQQIAEAKKVGVQHPENIRILLVDAIPEPDLPLLQRLGAKSGVVSQQNAAQTIRYGILMRKDQAKFPRLFRHEFTHVAQYENLGGIDGFLKQYAAEVLTVGYDRAPLELAAIRAEQSFTTAQK